ncbi:aldehyde dehydrogenase family protein [Alteromonadaceae bacterium M269]|nr:aldehyde dehydrogenase family protein [Alteromonadaceae bacterium M269]
MLYESPLVVVNPSSGSVITAVSQDTVVSAQNKIEACHKSFTDSKKSLSKARRINILEGVHRRLLDEQKELAELVAMESGKPLQDAIVESERAAYGVQLAIAHLMTEGSNTFPVNTMLSSENHRMDVHHFPIGPVIAVSAFNHPLNLVTHQIVSAFAAGCPCLIKPAVETPLSCIRLVELFRQEDIPDGWVDYLITEDNELAESVVTDPRFAFFSFIGSARVGWYLRSKLPPGTRCALEHGGVAPAIVDGNCDLEKTVASLVKGAFYHAGQVCVSTQRIFVRQHCVDNFIDAFAEHVEELRVGDALDMQTQVGPLIRRNEVERMHCWIKEAVQSGGQLVCGGQTTGYQHYEPTVIINAAENSLVNSQEIFGPVCSITSFSDLDSVVSRLNSRQVAFHSAVFSHDQRVINQLYEQLHTGCLMVNEHTAFRHDGMIFAGHKQSGLGAGGIANSIHHMQIAKLKITQY